MTITTSPRFALSEETYGRFPEDLPSLLRLPGLDHFAGEDGQRLLAGAEKQYEAAWRSSPLVPVRGVQRIFGITPWEWPVDDSDASFGRGPLRVGGSVTMGGVDVVGHRLNLGDGLTRDQGIFLLALLSLKRRTEYAVAQGPDSSRVVQTESEKLYEEILLRHVTRELRDPPIDLDVRDGSKEWKENGGLEHTRKVNTDYARRMCDSLSRLWGCKPVVYVTNPEKWSIHLDVLVPPGVRAAALCHRTARMKEISMKDCEIPDAADHGDVEKGPAIVCDSSIWVRDPSSRGGLWRPPLGRKYDKAAKKHKKHKKLWLKDLGDPSSLCEPPVGMEPVPFDRDCF